MIKSIAILMSTYNGERYLRQQLDSIINQDNNDWSLYIRDDGSTDNTVSIIKEYITKNSNIVLMDDSSNKGAALSFLYMLQNVEADYYMFCDQDDVWLENKISVSYKYFQEVVQTVEGQVCLVFSDAKVVDQNLEVIDESFWRFGKSFPEILVKNKNLIKVFNCAPGCTMFFNKNLKQLIANPDRDVFMHDWFLMLKAIEFGNIFYINQPLMLYRQHSNNVLGADKTSYAKSISKFLIIKKTIKNQLKLYHFIRKYSKTNLLEYYFLKVNFNIKRFLYLH